MTGRYLPSEAMAAAESAWIARMEHLLSVIGTPRVRTLADLTTNAVVEVNIDWADNPDIRQRAIRARTICELIEELKQESASWPTLKTDRPSQSSTPRQRVRPT